jgi:hypothetical protein
MIGVSLLLAAQGFSLWGIIGLIMPRLGLGILDLAEAVYAFDLPGRIFGLF